MRVAGRARYTGVYYDREIDNSHLVPQPDPAQKGNCGRLMGLGAVFFAVLFSIGMIHFKCVHYGYEIAQLQAERTKLDEANQKLRLDQALLSNPQRIDELARQDLALAPAQPQQLIHMGGTGAANSPASPAAPVMAGNMDALAPNSRGISREP